MLDSFRASQCPKLITLSDFFQSPSFWFWFFVCFFIYFFYFYLLIEFAYLMDFTPIFPLLPSGLHSENSAWALNPAAANGWQAGVCCPSEHGLVPWCAQSIWTGVILLSSSALPFLNESTKWFQK